MFSRIFAILLVSIPAGAEVNSARFAATVAVESNLNGTAANVYTTIDQLAGKYVRNTNCWAHAFDLSSVTIYNSHGMSLNEPTRRGGTLISPQHLIYTHHYPIPHGSILRFVGQDNTVIHRMLTSSKGIPNTDLHVGFLDAAVPTNIIHFATVLPADFVKWFPDSLDGVPTLAFNFSQQALVTDIASLRPSKTNANMIQYSVPVDPLRLKYYGARISGDSGQPSFLLLNGEPVLLTVWSSGGPGGGVFISGYTEQINEVMRQLGGNYRLTPIDLTEFPKFPGK